MIAISRSSSKKPVALDEFLRAACSEGRVPLDASPRVGLSCYASLIDRWAVRPSPVVAARSLAPAQMQASDSFPSRKVVRNQLTPAQVDALLTRVVELEARIDNLEGGGLPNVGS